jgi:hypothetical protein
LSAQLDLIRRCYAAFNVRDLDAALDGVHADVDQGRIVVDVHQVVRDLDGGVIADQHVYTTSAGLISRMDVRQEPDQR